jgi:iron complex outermembrane recepter protein
MTYGKAVILYATSALALAASCGARAEQNGSDASTAEAERSTIVDIVVTARRRAERLQSTPVSVSAVSNEKIQQLGITNIAQLTSLVPGVNFSSLGQPSNTLFSIRGRSKGVVGNAQPSVATYINEVPTSTYAAALPTYDLESVQVVKGPQGTLFGRNTTAGAILATTKAPTDELGGWGEVTLGSYHWEEFQGAINLPILGDKIGLRVATRIARRDGYTQNMTLPGQDFDDVHSNNVRGSLVLRPTDNLTNLTVMDYAQDNTHGAGVILYSYYGGSMANPALPWINGRLLSVSPAIPCNGNPVCDAPAALRRQIEAGPRKAWNNLPADSRSRTFSVINRTTWDIGSVTVKNIAGYRKVKVGTYSNVDGYDANIIDSFNLQDLRQFSDEFQVSGKSLNNRLSWIAGLFYFKAQPNGPNRLLVQSFAQAGTPLSSPTASPPLNGATGTADFFTDVSKAAYGQIGYNLGGISQALDGVSIDLGLRYTKDTNKACTIPSQLFAFAPPKPSDCPTAPLNNSSTQSSKLTYTIGLNWQATHDIFAYGVVRRGYRGGGVNTPRLGGTLVPFQGYSPETVDDIEIGIKSNFHFEQVRGRFNVAAYNSKYKGLIANISTASSSAVTGGPDGDFNSANDPGGRSFYSNVGEGRVRGVEAEFVLSPVRGLEFDLGAAWIGKKITSITLQLPSTIPVVFTPAALASTTFIAAPDYSYSAGANYTRTLSDTLGELSVDVRYFKISKVPYAALELPSYDRLDATLSWRDVGKSGLDLQVFVNNILNDASPVGPSLTSIGVGATSAIFQAPRMAGLRARFSWGGERR